MRLQMFMPSPWGCGDAPGRAVGGRGQPGCGGSLACAVWGRGTGPSPVQPPSCHASAPPGEEGTNVSCQAESYRGSFHCSWTGPRSAVFRARLTRRWVPQGPPNPAPAPWLPSPHACLPPDSDGSLGEWVPAAGCCGQFSASFTDPSFCPFAEELRQLQLQLEGLSDTSYLNFSIHFFIRDIGELRPAAAGSGGLLRGAGSPVGGLGPRAGQRCPMLSPALPAVRPDPPQELTVQRRGEQLHLTWAPPASWPLPKSYFALLYRLQYELPNGTQVTAGCPCPACPCTCRPTRLLCCAHPAPRPPCPSPSLGSSLCPGEPLGTGTCRGLSNGPLPATLLLSSGQ